MFCQTASKAQHTFPLFAYLIEEAYRQPRDFLSGNLPKLFERDYFKLVFSPPPTAISEAERQNFTRDGKKRLIWALVPRIPRAGRSALLKILNHKILKSLELVLPSDLAANFRQMLAGKFDFIASITLEGQFTPDDRLNPLKYQSVQRLLKVSFDEIKNEQQLLFHGVLTEVQKKALKAAHPSPLFAALLEEVQSQARQFFETHLQSFFEKGDFDELFDPNPNSMDETEIQDELGKKEKIVEDVFFFHVMLAEPDLLTDALLRALLEHALVNDMNLAHIFWSMWTGSIEYSATQVNVGHKNQLDPDEFIPEKSITVNYDETKQEQCIVYQGVLLDDEKAALEKRHPSPLFSQLLDKVQQLARQFFSEHLEPILLEGEFNLFFSSIPEGLNETETQNRLREKRQALTDSLLPIIQEKLSRQFLAETLAASLVSDPSLTEALLTDNAVLAEPEGKNALVEAFKAANQSGVSVEFFDDSGQSMTASTLPDCRPVGVKDADKVILDGYFEVATPGVYRFFVNCDKAGVDFNFNLAHLPEPLMQGQAGRDGAEFSEFAELKAGTLYHFTLSASKLKGGLVSAFVQGENLPKGSFSRLTLYPGATVERIRRAFLLLGKSLQLARTFQFNWREIHYLATHSADFEGFNLSELPTLPDPALYASGKARRLFAQFLRLANYAQLKGEIAGGSDDIIGIFEQARREKPAFSDLCQMVADLTRRTPPIVQEAARHLGYEQKLDNFAQEIGLQRLWEVLQLVERLGVPAAKVSKWVETIICEQNYPLKDAVAADLKNSVKALYPTETWERVAQPIFDELRQRKRDALAAYILHLQYFERIEELFEYFLIDPGMEPVVQTSRIRLAISSVQTFIQRCLLNLEKFVAPTAINSEQWQWMKRYRLWEANRKIFLYPENWLEPEFRDNKSPLFEELESALLQGDITNDRAEDAFFTYLQGLGDIGRLDPVAMCRQQNGSIENDVIHVIACTQNKPRKYFYRRYANAESMWTPWKPVGAQIENDHIVTVFWRGRLQLFWVTFTPKPQKPESGTLTPGQAIPEVAHEVKVQLHWCQYDRGQWSNPQYSGFEGAATAFVKDNKEFDESEVFIYAEKEAASDDSDGSVLVYLWSDSLTGMTPDDKTEQVLADALDKANKFAETANKAAEEAADAARKTRDDTDASYQAAKDAADKTRQSLLYRLAIGTVRGELVSNALSVVTWTTYMCNEFAKKHFIAVDDAKKAADTTLQDLQKEPVDLATANTDANESSNKTKASHDEAATCTSLVEQALNCVNTFYETYADTFQVHTEFKEALKAAETAVDTAKSSAEDSARANNAAIEAAAALQTAVKASAGKTDPSGEVKVLAFRVTGRYAAPQLVPTKRPPVLLYDVEAHQVTLYKHSGKFTAKGLELNGNSGKVQSADLLKDIPGSEFYLLPCVEDQPSEDAEDRQLRRLGPLFYKDRDNTFFVQPQWGVYPTLDAVSGYVDGSSGDGESELLGSVEQTKPPEHYKDTSNPFDHPSPESKYSCIGREDWATKPSTVIELEGEWICENGGLETPGIENVIAGRGDRFVYTTISQCSSGRFSDVSGGDSRLPAQLILVGSGGLTAAQTVAGRANDVTGNR